jgi:predicted DNA-binding transcriptional regulator AlpA
VERRNSKGASPGRPRANECLEWFCVSHLNGFSRARIWREGDVSLSAPPSGFTAFVKKTCPKPLRLGKLGGFVIWYES